MLEIIFFLFSIMFGSLSGFLFLGLPLLLSFVLQLFLCLRTKRLPIRLIPVFLAVLATLLCPILAVIQKWYCGFEFVLFLGLVGFILLGSAAGWLVYAAARACRKGMRLRRLPHTQSK